MAKKLVQVVKNGQVYQLSVPDIEESIAEARQYAYEANHSLLNCNTLLQSTSGFIGMKDVPYFDSSKAYNQNDLVVYKRSGDTEAKVWRCLNNRTAAPWDDNAFQETSLYAEYLRFRNDGADVEVARVKVTSSSSTFSVQGVNVYFLINGTQYTVQTDSDGIAQYVIPYGTAYTISFEEKTGYDTIHPITHVAHSSLRTFTVLYHVTGDGLTVIDDEGDEFGIDNWDTGRNLHARLLRYHDSNVSFCLKIGHVAQSAKWQVESVTIPDIPMKTATTAPLDFDTVYNNQAAWADAVSLVAAYNASHGTSLTVEEYIPAFAEAKRVTVVVNGQTLHGMLPAAGALLTAKNNMTDINHALVKLGAGGHALASGRWWSSSQYSGSFAWYLSYGSLYGSNKTGSCQVLPFFDF